MTSVQGAPPATRGPSVIVLEAPSGPERTHALRRWLRGAARAGASGRWLLACGVERGGLWAGVNEWMESLVPDIEVRAPDLFRLHDAELTQVLPALRTRVRPRFITLTEASEQDEAVRNYAADRARRIPHGLVDLLDEWHGRAQATWWALACDEYDGHGAITGHFFQSLVRRRGDKLGLVLLLAVEPGSGERVAAEFEGFAPVARIVLSTRPAEPGHADVNGAAREAERLEAHAMTDTLLVRQHAHELIRLWTQASRSDRAARWHSLALGMLTHGGYYEDALRHVQPVLENLALFDGEIDSFYSRASLLNKLQVVLVTLGRPREALDLLLREGLCRITDPAQRVKLLYQVAMLHARFLPERDLDAAEATLREALAELESASLDSGERQFQIGFLLNGLAYVRMRQGDAREAASLSHQNFERLEQHLPATRHRLHRSVLLYNAGQVYARSGDLVKAVLYFSQAMEMDPFYSEYYNDRGSVLLRQGRLAEAESDFRRAIELSSPYPEVWFNLGQCLARQQQRAHEAEAAFERTVDLDPTRVPAWVNLGRTRQQQGRPAEALEAYDRAIALEENPFVLANRAAVLLQLGRGGDAMADLDRAVTLAPDHPALQRNRALARDSVAAAVPATV